MLPWSFSRYMPNPLTITKDIQIHLQGGPYDGKTVMAEKLPTFVRIHGDYANGWQIYMQSQTGSHVYNWIHDEGTEWIFLR